jgi:hypothetical protein
MNPALRQIQNVGLVTLIAALIWLYAEGQDVSDVSRQITVTLPDRVGQNMVVTSANGESSTRLTVTFKGATAPLGQVQAGLGSSATVQLPLDASRLPEGPQGPLTLAPLIAQVHVNPNDPASPTVSQLGVSVVNVDPADLLVNVTELVPVEVPVRFRPPGVQLGASVRIDPAEVTVEVPRAVAEQYAAAPDSLAVEAAIRPEQLANMPEGVAQTMTLNLRQAGILADVKHARLQTRTADVTFTIERQKASYVAPLVPVWLVAPPSELERFAVKLKEQNQVLRDVTITGPRNVIEQLREAGGTVRVIARFELTGDQLDRGVTSAPLSSIEIQRTEDGVTQVQHVVPLNPDALQPGLDPPPPTFVGINLTVTASSPIVEFTVTRRTE